MSNTKLLPTQKSYIKAFEKENNVFFFNNGKITVMVWPEFKNSRMFVVSVATMSPDETKFRKYVGRYFAATNFEKGQYILMDKVTLFEFLHNAMCITSDDDYSKLDSLEFN